VDLDTVADELYGLPPEEFTAARTAAEKEAKAAGEMELAAQIRTLAKPNQVAGGAGTRRPRRWRP